MRGIEGLNGLALNEQASAELVVEVKREEVGGRWR